VTEEDEWTYSFTNLAKFNAGEEIVYTVTENSVNDYTTETDGTNIINHHTPGKTSATVTKNWQDANNQDGKRVDVIEVQLTAEGEAYGDPIELSSENKWTYTWDGLDEKATGETIKYSVVELTEVPEYETTVNDTDHGNIIITNAYTPEVTEVSGIKTWDDTNNQDGVRPESITVNLLANGEVVDSIEVTEEDEWTYSFTNLARFNAGEEIVYTVTENSVNDYTTEIDGTNIINHHTPEVTEVSGIKTWDDSNNQDGVRPESITVNLLANGEVVDSIEVTEEDEWTYSFTNLAKFNAGEEIVYTVTENSVNDYTTETDGTNIINHHTPGKTSATVTKNWQDANNQDGKRVDVIEVQLTAEGEAYGDPIELSSENKWTYTWDGLDEKATGETIKYSVVELTEVPEYETTVNDTDHGNIIITNAYTPETVDINGEKTWKDADNQDGIRPNSITLNLFADNEFVESVEVTEAGDWSFSFTNLPKHKGGKEIEYTISEEKVEGYKTTIDGFDITNVRVGTTSVEGTKTWKDDNSKDRPDSIVVELLQNGNKIQEVKVSAADSWAYSFTNLPEFDEDGVAYIYTIEEQVVAGYISTVEGYDLINTLIPVISEDEVSEGTTPDSKDDQNGPAKEVSGTTDSGSKLPSTATNMYNLLALGVGLLIVGFAILLAYRRKREI
ncbi:hypothetical protein CIT14_20430, partial [Virgibacillus profundi]